MTDAEKYDGAKFYDACASDEYVHEDPAEAIRERVLRERIGGESTAACLARICPIEVHAMAPDPVESKWADHQAEQFLETLVEEFSDDYGDPDGQVYITTDSGEAVLVALRKAVELASETWDVWRCTKVSSRVYTAGQAAYLLEG